MWDHAPSWQELRKRAQTAQSDAMALLADMHLPHMPSSEELRERACQMFASSPSMDDIVQRAREMILEKVATELRLTASASA